MRYIAVGKVRILRSIDDHYLEGIVVEGNVKDGDLVRKGITSCLVAPHAPAGKRGE
jgi:hypothetical protein